MANDTKGQVENILSELGKKIDLLIVEAKDASGEIRDDLEVKIVDLKRKKDKLEKDFEEYKDQNEDKWTDAKTHLFAALNELKKAIEAVFKDNKSAK